MEATQIAPEAQSNTFGQKSLKLVKSRPACACYQTPPDFPHGLLDFRTGRREAHTSEITFVS
jgi:hypothetical protein